MNTLEYIVNYSYYKYNSGGGDNGYFSDQVVFDSADYDKALSLYKNLQLAIKKLLNSQEEDLIKRELIPYDGYFTEASLVKSFKKNVFLNEAGEEVDKENNKAYIFQHTDYNDCTHCYDKHEGQSTGCDLCNNTGIRQLTHENVMLALSAQEWIEDQVRQLWKDYNEIYQLNLGVYGWKLYNNTIMIEAGYSCRGSSNTKDYELPLEWLYAKNRKELIKKQYNIETQETQIEQHNAQLAELARLKKAAVALEKQLNLNQE